VRPTKPLHISFPVKSGTGSGPGSEKPVSRRVASQRSSHDSRRRHHEDLTQNVARLGRNAQLLWNPRHYRASCIFSPREFYSAGADLTPVVRSSGWFPLEQIANPGAHGMTTQSSRFYTHRIFFDNPSGKSISLYRLEYASGMADAIAVHLPRPLVERVDAVASDELRSRANTIRWLVDEALRRHESGAQEDRMESR
jgi:hypothetical protein